MVKSINLIPTNHKIKNLPLILMGLSMAVLFVSCEYQDFSQTDGRIIPPRHRELIEYAVALRGIGDELYIPIVHFSDGKRWKLYRSAFSGIKIEKLYVDNKKITPWKSLSMPLPDTSTIQLEMWQSHIYILDVAPHGTEPKTLSFTSLRTGDIDSFVSYIFPSEMETMVIYYRIRFAGGSLGPLCKATVNPAYRIVRE